MTARSDLLTLQYEIEHGNYPNWRFEEYRNPRDSRPSLMARYLPREESYRIFSRDQFAWMRRMVGDTTGDMTPVEISEEVRLRQEHAALRQIVARVAACDPVVYAAEPLYCAFRCGGRVLNSDEGTHYFEHGASCPYILAQRWIAEQAERKGEAAE